MDYGKLGVTLLAALASCERASDEPLPIFVELAAGASQDQAVILRELGATGTIEGHKIVTASANRQQIDVLCEKPWVIGLSLSGKLHPLSSERAHHAAT